MKYIIANWKANKTYAETQQWMTLFLQHFTPSSERSVIVCPPFSLLSAFSQHEGFIIGSQDVSAYEEGPYTGEVTAQSLSGLATYTLIGHSERRRELHETEEMIQKKLQNAQKAGIKTILCVRGEKDIIYPEASMFAYEPINAIGSGNNESPDNVIAMKKTLQIPSSTPFIYGGSVTEENCADYLQHEEIDGVLVGSASLDPVRFATLVSK